MKSRFSKFWHIAEQIVRSNIEQFTISGTGRAISRVLSLSEIAKAAGGGICQRRASDTGDTSDTSDTEKVADEVEELSQYDVYHRESTQIRIGDAIYGLPCIEVEQAGADCRGGCPCFSSGFLRCGINLTKIH